MLRLYANMRVAAKLGLAGACFVLPLAFIVWALVAEQNIAVRFAAQEALGARYLAGLATVQGDAAFLSLTGSAKAADGLRLAGMIADSEARFGATMQSDAQAAATQAAWRNQGGLDDGRAKLRDLIARIGDRSNLILDNVLDTYYLADVVLNRLPDILDRLADLAHADAAHSSAEARAQFLVGLGTLVGDIDGMDGSMSSAEQADGGAGIRAAIDEEYRRLHTDLEQVVDELKSAHAGQAALGDVLRRSALFSEHANSELGSLLSARVLALRTAQMRILALTGLLFTAASGAMMVAVRSGVTRPLQRLRAATLRLAEGDLDSALPVRTTSDELGDLLQAVHEFRGQGRLKRRLEQEAEAARQRRERQQEAVQRHSHDFGVSVSAVLSALTQSAQVMRGAAAEMAHSVEQMRATSSSTAAGAAESSRNLVAVAAATEEMTGSVDEIGRQVRDAALLARDGVTKGEATDQTMRGLNEAAGQINGITRLIFDIASKTNLLALNATIEAARAGEAGRGFAVVAAEVKTLAEQTSQATQQISAQIQAMQTGTVEAVAAVQEMAEGLHRMDEVAASIAGKVDDQGVATREIASSVQAVARQNDDAAADMQAVAAIVETSIAVSGVVLAASDEVAKVSETLLQEVNQYLAALRQEGESERRRWVRVSCGNAPAELVLADGSTISARLIDISKGGASLAGAGNLPVGAKLDLNLPGGHGMAGCTVVRTTAGALGIFFRQETGLAERIDAILAAFGGKNPDLRDAA